MFGFSQPYVRNRPLNLGFQIYNNKQELQRVQELPGHHRPVGQPDRRAVVHDAELQPGLHRPQLLRQLSAQAARLPACGIYLFAEQIDDYRVFTASQTYFRPSAFAPAFRAPTRWLASSTAMPPSATSTTPSTTPCARATGKEYTAVLQTSGIWGNVRYIAPMMAYKQFRSMHYLTPSPTGRNVLGLRAQLSYVQGYGGAVAPPNNRFYTGGEGDLRGFDVRALRPTAMFPLASISSTPLRTAVAFRSCQASRNWAYARRFRFRSMA